MTEKTSTAKTVIADDIEIVGTVKCASNIEINGRLNGDLSCTGDAVIGETAIVKGNMVVNSSTVHGQINGNVTAKDKIELKSTAKINGDVRAKRMTVEDGVMFVGKAEVNASGRVALDPSKSVHDISPVDNEEESDDKAKEPKEENNKGGLFGKRS